MRIRRRIEKNQEFPAFDSDGRRYTVREFVELREVPLPDSLERQWQPVRWTYSTNDLQLVDKLADGSLLLTRSGVRLRRSQ
jgi:hypothetical protein